MAQAGAVSTLASERTEPPVTDQVPGPVEGQGATSLPIKPLSQTVALQMDSTINTLDMAQEGTLWKAIESVRQLCLETISRLDDMARGNGLTESRFSEVEERVTSLEETNVSQRDRSQETESQVAALAEEVRELRAYAHRSDIVTSRLQGEMDKLKAHSMRNNIIFTMDTSSKDEYKELLGENCANKVRLFLSRELKVPRAEKVYIETAHRFGPKSSPGKERPIIARIPISEEQDAILRNTSVLRGSKSFVSRQLTPVQRERKDFALPMYLEKRKQVGTQAKLFQSQLTINGRVQTQFEAPPSVPPRQPDKPPCPLAQGAPIQDDGSTFRGYAAVVQSAAAVHDTLTTAMSTPDIAKANHVMYAYRTVGPNGSVNENFSSDGDHGVGLEMLKALRTCNATNMIWLCTRVTGVGYRHIGPRRFRHAVTACKDAMRSLTPRTS